MKKKFFAAALAAVMVLSSALTAFAADVTGTTSYGDGLVVDGSEDWNSIGGDQYVLTGDFDSTITFHNDAFIRGTDNWFNFVFEFFGGDAKGITLRADAYAWTYGEGAQEPTYVAEIDWVWGTDDFVAISDDVDVNMNVKKTSATDITVTINFGTTNTEVYTITYPDGIPEELRVQVGSDGGKITLLNYKDNNDVEEELPTEANPLDTPESGDANTAIFFAIVCAAAVAVVTVLRKKEVTE